MLVHPDLPLVIRADHQSIVYSHAHGRTCASQPAPCRQPLPFVRSGRNLLRQGHRQRYSVPHCHARIGKPHAAQLAAAGAAVPASSWRQSVSRHGVGGDTASSSRSWNRIVAQAASMPARPAPLGSFLEEVSSSSAAL